MCLWVAVSCAFCTGLGSAGARFISSSQLCDPYANPTAAVASYNPRKVTTTNAAAHAVLRDAATAATSKPFKAFLDLSRCDAAPHMPSQMHGAVVEFAGSPAIVAQPHVATGCVAGEPVDQPVHYRQQHTTAFTEHLWQGPDATASSGESMAGPRHQWMSTQQQEAGGIPGATLAARDTAGLPAQGTAGHTHQPENAFLLDVHSCGEQAWNPMDDGVLFRGCQVNPGECPAAAAVPSRRSAVRPSLCSDAGTPPQHAMSQQQPAATLGEDPHNGTSEPHPLVLGMVHGQQQQQQQQSEPQQVLHQPEGWHKGTRDPVKARVVLDLSG